jgi:hypothetical protein
MVAQLMVSQLMVSQLGQVHLQVLLELLPIRFLNWRGRHSKYVGTVLLGWDCTPTDGALVLMVLMVLMLLMVLHGVYLLLALLLLVRLGGMRKYRLGGMRQCRGNRMDWRIDQHRGQCRPRHWSVCWLRVWGWILL